MKLEFQAKFLQHLNQKKQQDEGFTLIELLVVIIIIGILAAIALPSLLAQVNKGKQAEAKQNIGAINRAQQAYYLEQTVFASDIKSVGIGISSQTVNYYYTITASATTVDSTSAWASNYGSRNSGKATLKSYLGLNFVTTAGTGTGTEVLALGKVCETNDPADNTATTNATSCPGSYKDLGAK